MAGPLLAAASLMADESGGRKCWFLRARWIAAAAGGGCTVGVAERGSSSRSGRCREREGWGVCVSLLFVCSNCVLLLLVALHVPSSTALFFSSRLLRRLHERSRSRRSPAEKSLEFKEHFHTFHTQKNDMDRGKRKQRRAKHCCGRGRDADAPPTMS